MINLSRLLGHSCKQRLVASKAQTLTSVVSGLVANIAESCRVQIFPEHLSWSLTGMIHASLDGALHATSDDRDMLS